MSILSRFRPQGQTLTLKDVQNVMAEKTEVQVLKETIQEYEDLLNRIFHKVVEIGGVKRNTSSITYCVSIRMMWKWWLDDVDKKEKEAAEREKIAVIVREEIANSKKKGKS